MSLPVTFAEEVLDLEMKVQVDKSLDALSKLVQLYATAIEHYEACGDSRFEYYKSRMQALLNKQIPILSPNSEKERHSIIQIAADRMIRKHQKESTFTSRMLKFDLENQQAALYNRLSKRNSNCSDQDSEELRLSNPSAPGSATVEKVKSQPFFKVDLISSPLSISAIRNNPSTCTKQKGSKNKKYTQLLETKYLNTHS